MAIHVDKNQRHLQLYGDTHAALLSLSSTNHVPIRHRHSLPIRHLATIVGLRALHPLGNRVHRSRTSMPTAYVAPFLPRAHATHVSACALRGARVRVRTRRKRSRAQQPHCQLEPVEDGVTLPRPASHEALLREASWLAAQLTAWLDAEWRQTEPAPIHEQIGAQTARIYARQRMEGEDDLSSVLIAIGSELEGMDFSDAFVGPWNVANKMSEFLLRYRAGPRTVVEPAPAMETVRLSGDGERGRELMWDSGDEVLDQVRQKVGSDDGFATATSLGDHFERLKFLKDVLDGSVGKGQIDGAVAVALGYRFDTKTNKWDGSDVEDEHFRRFGNEPPDLLGDEQDGTVSETLQYLESQLHVEDEIEDERLEESLYTVIETLHGVELTKIQSQDVEDHQFHKRVIVAKWLHLHGGFL